MNKKELQEILESHRKWIKGEQGGKCANLRNADLRGADLYGANLCGADLYGANLYGADLYGADLYGANLCGADLYGANLCGANLRSANLCGANLRSANLRNADLRGADLRGANLYGADLRSANLRNADLRGADLRSANLCGANLRNADLYGADLRSANLCGANLYGAKLDIKELIRKGFIVQRKLTGWKKCQNNILVKLEIPKGAIVFSINNNKCRTNIAKVVKIEGGNGKEAISQHDIDFVYKLGKTVSVPDFDCQHNVECGTGIHFFRTKKEAKNY